MTNGRHKALVVASKVADDVEARIRHGEFRRFELLPDLWALANEYGVWFETMRSAADRLVNRELVSMSPSLALRVTGYAVTVLDSVHNRRCRLRELIEHQMQPLLDALDRGDMHSKEHLHVVGSLLVRLGFGYLAESGLDVGGLKHDFRILLSDAERRFDR